MVSACLLGEYCRYDGKTKQVPKLLEKLQGYEIIPFCPEAPLFGTPRERISVVKQNGAYRIEKESGADVTQPLRNQIESFFQGVGEVDCMVLKSKSPSCGNGTTPILNEHKEQIGLGDGLAVAIIKQKFHDVTLYDEVSLLEK